MGNTLGDLFYPDNPKRRAKVVQLTQTLYDYMKANFRASNHLSDFLNKNCTNCNFEHISVNEDHTVKQNCDVLETRIKQMQAIIEKVDKLLAEKLDPDLYRKLTNVDISFEERVQTAKNVMHVVTGVVIAAAAIAVIAAIASGGVLAPVIAVIGLVATSAIATVVISLIGGLVIGSITQAITGAIERSKLEHAIDSLQHSCEVFIPASNKYTEKIYEVLAELKMNEL